MFDQRPGRGPTSAGVCAGAWNTGPYHAYGPAKTVTIEAQGGEEMEMRVLGRLLAVFPAFSLEDIAQAYTEADSNANAAAELLATRQPIVRSNGVQEGWKNYISERKTNGYRRQSAEQPVVNSDDLLLEKYGRGVGELINRVSEKQSNSLLHNVQSAHDGASHNPFHLNSRTPHGVRWDNRGEVVNKEDSYGVSGDGPLLVGRKKAKQKGRGGLDNEVEVADAVVSRQDSFKGDTQKSLEVILQMASSTPQAHDVDTTINQDGCYFDDKEMDGRIPSYYQRTESHVDKAPMQISMEYQKCQKGLWNRPNLAPKAGSMANDYSHQRSIKDTTDHDQLKISVSLKELKEWFPDVPDRYLLKVLQSNNFVLSDAVQVLLDATADKHLTNSSAESNMDLGNRSNTYKFNVPKESDPLVTTRPPPLKAAWADVERTITPLKHNWTDVSLKRGLPEKTSEGKSGLAQLKSCGNIDDYGRHRLGAHGHWRVMDYYFKEAAAAYGRGEHCRAATLAEKGKEQKQLAQEADGRASQRLFQSRNKDIVNNITIDLHAQHVSEAINVLKRHLQTLCSILSVHMLTVITGYGSHSMNGRAKIKPAVTAFLSRSGIPWEEVNEGCLTVKMIDVRNKVLDLSDDE